MQGLNISMVNAGSNNFNSYASIQGFRSGVAAATPLALQPTSGNVGIGTTNPANKLEVSKVIRIFAAQDATPTLAFNVNPASFSDAYITGEDSGGYGHNIGFYTSANSASAVKRMTILGNGNVGIGTANPSMALSVGSYNGILSGVTFTLSGSSSVSSGLVLPPGGMFMVSISTTGTSIGNNNTVWYYYGLVGFNSSSYVGSVMTPISSNNVTITCPTTGNIVVTTPAGTGSYTWTASAMRVC